MEGSLFSHTFICWNASTGFPFVFADYHCDYVKPVKSTFRGYEVHECPPAGQGVIALLILKILEQFDATDDPIGADRVHREIEATRLAY